MYQFSKAEDLKTKYAIVQKKIYNSDSELRSLNHIYKLVENIKE